MIKYSVTAKYKLNYPRYPDMLEVGMVEGPLSWNRAHFGGWAISSSPLIIGADLTDTALLEAIVPILANPEAIKINQVRCPRAPGRCQTPLHCSDLENNHKGGKYVWMRY